jgi:hypothetical protein
MVNRQPGEIEDEVAVGGTPGSPNGTTPATPSKKVELKSLAERQYVAGSASQWYLNMPQALPFASDDIQRTSVPTFTKKCCWMRRCKSVV